MEEKTVLNKINDIIKKEQGLQQKQNSLFDKGEDLRKEKANLLLQYFKEEKVLSFMTWIYYGKKCGTKITLEAKEDWNKCPQQLVDFLKPSYHDHFYFFVDEDGIDELEKGIKLGIHFSDGDINITIEVNDEDNKDKITDFLKKYKIKIQTDNIEKEIKEHKKGIEEKERILEFVKNTI